VGELLGQRQVGPGQESAAHLYVGGVGPARITLLPVERSGYGVARGDLVGVFDELLGVDRLRLGNALQFLFGLKK
jgi:hypothetical protein